MQRILTVVGARPQFVKAAVVSAAISADPSLEEILVHTGQHYDSRMSDIFFEELGISPPSISLGIGSGLHGHQTGRMLAEIEKSALEVEPDWLLVYGDTNSTIAGALAASKLHIPIAHIEAGLRSFNRQMPEEINRVVTDHLSTLLFVPTDEAELNLHREGIYQEVHQVGDVMYDAALCFASAARNKATVLETLGISSDTFALVTIHRAENTDNKAKLSSILTALGKIASNEIEVLFPLHPRTLAALKTFDLKLPPNINVCEPLSYFEMLYIESRSKVIITDSGGVQKEAFFHKVPCVTLRDETEWKELVNAEWNVLCTSNSPDAIVKAAISSIGKIGKDISPYGDGKASEKIVNIISNR